MENTSSDPITPPAQPIIKDEEWIIEVYHSAYYHWLPVKSDELTFVDRVEDEDGVVEAYYTENSTGEKVIAVDSYYPDFKMVRRTITESTKSTSGVNVSSIRRSLAERKALGFPTKPLFSTIVEAWQDGTWAKQFPLDSVTDIKVIQGPDTLADKIKSLVLEEV